MTMMRQAYLQEDLICDRYVSPLLEFQLARRPSMERMNASATPTQVDNLPRAGVRRSILQPTYGSNKYGSCYSGQRASSLHRSPFVSCPLACHPACLPAWLLSLLSACLPAFPIRSCLVLFPSCIPMTSIVISTHRVAPPARDSLHIVAIHLP